MILHCTYAKLYKLFFGINLKENGGYTDFLKEVFCFKDHAAEPMAPAIFDLRWKKILFWLYIYIAT